MIGCDPSFNPVESFAFIRKYIVTIDMEEITIPQKVVSGVCPVTVFSMIVAISPAVRR